MTQMPLMYFMQKYRCKMDLQGAHARIIVRRIKPPREILIQTPSHRYHPANEVICNATAVRNKHTIRNEPSFFYHFEKCVKIIIVMILNSC